jgi:hypothetical protein
LEREANGVCHKTAALVEEKSKEGRSRSSDLNEIEGKHKCAVKMEKNMPDSDRKPRWKQNKVTNQRPMKLTIAEGKLAVPPKEEATQRVPLL